MLLHGYIFHNVNFQPTTFMLFNVPFVYSNTPYYADMPVLPRYWYGLPRIALDF